MSDNQLTVVRADSTTETLRSLDLGAGVQGQVVLAADGPEVCPVLTGATLSAAISSSAVALVPPTATARTCWLRIWHATADTTVRVFYRRDGTSPLADGSNAESFLVHGEGRSIRLPDLTKFKMIAETGAAFTAFMEFSNT